MRLYLRKLMIAIVPLSIIIACNKVENPTYNDRPVVNGYLIAGRHPVVSVSRQLYTSSGVAVSSENLDALIIHISDDSTVYTLTLQDTAYTDTSLIIQADKTYHLSFMYNGKEVTASTTVPSHPQDYTQSDTSISVDKIDMNSFTPGFMGGFSIPDPIDITWTNDNNSYYMLLVENLETTPELVRDTISGDNRPAFSFRNQPAISSSETLPSMSFEYFGRYRLVLFHLQPEYATLYEDNGSSSQDLTTPVTNISNGFGIFTGINADTLYLNVIKN